jgi:hypothetical protein
MRITHSPASAVMSREMIEDVDLFGGERQQ